jgi:hypothetical protein
LVEWVDGVMNESTIKSRLPSQPTNNKRKDKRVIVDIKPQTAQEAIDNEFVLLPQNYQNWPLASKNVDVFVQHVASEDEFVKDPFNPKKLVWKPF